MSASVNPSPRPAGGAVGRRQRVRRELLGLRPAPNAERVAIRAGLTLAIALLVLDALHQVPLALYASFGMFPSVYGGRTPSRTRWRVQLRHAAILLGAVATGGIVGLSAHRGWLTVLAGSVWAVVAATASDRQRWVPPGPMIPVFAVVSCAAVPMTPASLLRALLVFAATAALAMGLAVLEAWRLPASSPPPPGGAHPAAGNPARHRVQRWRCGAAVLVAGSLAMLLGVGHPYWAMPACVVPLSVAGVTAQLARGIHRMIGTLVGLPIAALLIWLPVPLWVLLLLVALVQCVVELLVSRHYGMAMAFITPLALVLGHVAMPMSTSVLMRDRTVETVIGAVVGMATAWLTRPRRPQPRHAAPA